MALIAGENISVRFRDGTVGVHHLSFVVERHDLVSVAGHSGAGKSTLLRLLMAALVPTEGRIHLDGQDPIGWSRRTLLWWRRAVGHASQDLVLLEHRTVRDNVAYALRIRVGASWDDARIAADECLERLDVSHKAEDYPRQLSGGERQRVVVAQAAIGDPQLVVADEPTSNLDIANARLVFSLLADVHARGSTVVAATHRPELLAGLASRSLVLDGGQLRR